MVLQGKISITITVRCNCFRCYKKVLPSLVEETIGLDIKGTEDVFKRHFGEDFPFYDVRKLRVEYVVRCIEDNGIPIA